MANARERIEKVISENPVVLFMKGTPEFPQCGFSGQVIQILDYLGAPVVGVNVLEDADIRQGIKEYANWPTIPQLYVKGEFVGGCDIMREMFQSGELAAMLTDAGVPVKSSSRRLIALRRDGPSSPHRSREVSSDRDGGGLPRPDVGYIPFRRTFRRARPSAQPQSEPWDTSPGSATTCASCVTRAH